MIDHLYIQSHLTHFKHGCHLQQSVAKGLPWPCPEARPRSTAVASAVQHMYRPENPRDHSRDRSQAAVFPRAAKQVGNPVGPWRRAKTYGKKWWLLKFGTPRRSIETKQTSENLRKWSIHGIRVCAPYLCSFFREGYVQFLSQMSGVTSYSLKRKVASPNNFPVAEKNATLWEELVLVSDKYGKKRSRSEWLVSSFSLEIAISVANRSCVSRPKLLIQARLWLSQHVLRQDPSGSSGGDGDGDADADNSNI